MKKITFYTVLAAFCILVSCNGKQEPANPVYEGPEVLLNVNDALWATETKTAYTPGNGVGLTGEEMISLYYRDADGKYQGNIKASPTATAGQYSFTVPAEADTPLRINKSITKKCRKNTGIQILSPAGCIFSLWIGLQVTAQDIDLLIQRKIQLEVSDDIRKSSADLLKVDLKVIAACRLFPALQQQIRNLLILWKTLSRGRRNNIAPVRITADDIPDFPELPRVCKGCTTEFRNHCPHNNPLCNATPVCLWNRGRFAVPLQWNGEPSPVPPAPIIIQSGIFRNLSREYLSKSHPTG